MKDTTIEKQFFDYYEMGGWVDKCINFVEYEYNLNPYSIRVGEHKELNPFAKIYYFKELPDLYEGKKNWFDDMLYRPQSPLIDEIEANLETCNNQAETDRYIFGLLKPFKQLSNRLHPIADIERREADIKECEKDIEFWKTFENQDKPLFNTAKEPSGTPRVQIKACEEMIVKYKQDIERFKFVSDQFIRLLCSDQINNNCFKPGYVEYVLSEMIGYLNLYSNRLYAMLIQHGIELKDYQRKAGIYLKTHWNIAEIDYYVGSRELAEYYISQLKKESAATQTETPEHTNTQTPNQRTTETSELLTPRQKEAVELLMPFFKALEAADDIYIKNAKAGEKYRKILTIKELGQWEFATNSLAGYIGKKIAQFTDCEGIALIVALTGKTSEKLHSAISASSYPIGAEETDKILNNFMQTLPKKTKTSK